MIENISRSYRLESQHNRMMRSVDENRMIVEDGLEEKLMELDYPLAFMDFETIFPTIPRYEGTRPEQQVPFQWSVHVLESRDGAPEHHEFLAVDALDPRLAFITCLLDVLERTGQGHIMVYYRAFEETRLRELSEHFPWLARRIDCVCRRLWDLLPVIRNYIYHPAFKGSFSLKSVLPALVPEMSYEGMDVGNGLEAGRAFVRMIDGDVNGEEKMRIRKSLLEYCGQDTLAMVEILKVLYREIGK